MTKSLEDRIRAIEDCLEIYNLIASHPPSADTGADYYTRVAYVEDGKLDLGRGKATAGNETIAAVTKTPAHQAAIAEWHFLLPARIFAHIGKGQWLPSHAIPMKLMLVVVGADLFTSPWVTGQELGEHFLH